MSPFMPMSIANTTYVVFQVVSRYTTEHGVIDLPPMLSVSVTEVFS